MALELTERLDTVFGLADPSNWERLMRLEAIREPDEVTIGRLIEVFEKPAPHLKLYSDAFINQAFWDLSSEAFPLVYRPSIDWALRRRFIRSFETLFRNLFAACCTPTLGDRSEEGNPLNSACHMWWDFDCWLPAPDPLTRNPNDSAFLESVRSILAIEHVACQESALHGLGHWHRAQSAAVESIIDQFLASHPALSEPLREYAAAARCGYVQ